MSERAVLALVVRYPHPTALARYARDPSVFVTLRRLESQGLVRRRRGLYRLTSRARHELDTAHAVIRLLARALSI